MLFGMFKEKEVIENANFDTTKGDIVEDFGGVINNQSNDKDLIHLSSFNESHSEDINYQNIDLNNLQPIISSNTNIPNMGGINYQPINTQQQNNYNTNYQNIPINNQQTINPNYQQQYYNQYQNINTQPMMQNIQTPNPMQFGNSNNYEQTLPIQKELQTNIEQNKIEQPINEQINNTNIENDNIVQNSPVEILTKVPEKVERTNLADALLGSATQENTNIQQESSLSSYNEIENQEINNNEQQILETPNIENVQDNNIELKNTITLPVSSELISSQINIEEKENIEIDNTQKTVEPDKTEHEHKFIISDNIDVEPGFKICPKCGQKIRDDYRLCFVCGTYF